MKRNQNYKDGLTSGRLTAMDKGIKWCRRYLAAKRTFQTPETSPEIIEYWNGYEAGLKQAERYQTTKTGKLWANLESEALNLYQGSTWQHAKPNLKRLSVYLARATRTLQELNRLAMLKRAK